MEAKVYALPLRTPYRWAKGIHTMREGIVFRAEIEGHVGWGEAVLPPDGDLKELKQTIKLNEVLAELDLKEDNFLKRLDALDLPGFIRCGISTAWLSARASMESVSLAEYLGRGFRRPAASVPVNGFITEATVQEALERARSEVEKGFGTLKVKCTREHELDNRRIAEIRRWFPAVNLRLDPNESWGDDALERLRYMARFGIEYVEQPLPEQEVLANPARSHELRRTSPIPIALDQSVSGLEAAKRILEMELADVLILKAPAIGGLDRCVEIIRMAEDFGVACVMTSGLETVVGRAASLHCAALLKPPIPACGLSLDRFFQQDLAILPMKNGFLEVPTAPGLGVDISDWWEKEAGISADISADISERYNN
jgi:o-succinylbenzoate synthase